MSDDDFIGNDIGERAGDDDPGSYQSIERTSDAGPRKPVDPTSRMLRTLGNDRRRYVLSRLRESSDDVTSLSELAKVIARRESEDGGAPVERTLEEITVSLHHAHLPKLQASELIDYDVRSGAVRYLENPDAEALVELAVEGDS